MSRALRVVYVVTSPKSADILLRGQLAYMREAGFEVTLVSGEGPQLTRVAAREGVEVIGVPMQRTIDARADARALAALVALFRALRPDVVNAGTTKAGLLGMIAARIVGTPARIYLLRGLRLETSAGALRATLGAAERLSSRCATDIVAVSPSLRRAYLAGGFAPERKVIVLGEGSSNGVDMGRFGESAGEVARLRTALGLAEGAPVVGFVGRFTRDKGIAELYEAFERVAARRPDARLLLVGDFEAGYPVPEQVVARIVASPRVLRPGFVADVTPYYPLMDVLALPSHREGFPNVPLEAAACGVPTVGARATGTVDAVLDGRTGTLVPRGDAHALAEALLRYLEDPELRRRHGEAGRRRVEASFRPRQIWSALAELYRSRARG